MVSFLWLGLEFGQLEHNCCWGRVHPMNLVHRQAEFSMLGLGQGLESPGKCGQG